MATTVDVPGDSLDTLTEQLSPKHGPDMYNSVSHGDFKFHVNSPPAQICRPKRKVLDVPEQRKFQTEAGSSFAKFAVSPPRASFKPKPRRQQARPFQAVSTNSDQFKWVYVKPPAPFKPINSKTGYIASAKRDFVTTNAAYSSHGVQPRATNYKPVARYRGTGKPFAGVSESMSAFQVHPGAKPRKPFKPERKTMNRVDDRDWSTQSGSTQAQAIVSPKKSSKIQSSARAAASSRPNLEENAQA